jgi:integrase
MPPRRRGFGSIRQLPSKRWQAFYVGPDTARHVAPTTFETKLDAEGWLTDERRLITAGTWVAPAVRDEVAARNAPRTFGSYASSWLERRDLKPRTRAHYRVLLRDHLLPTFEHQPLSTITVAAVADWHHELGKRTGPTYRAHAYALLRTIFLTAVSEDEVAASPCRIRGAGTSKRVKQIEPATLPQLEALTTAMPERLRMMVLLAAWCALRFGELTEMRRKDVDLKNGLLHVRRAVVRADGVVVIGDPKSDAGKRTVAIPPHLLPALRDHINTHAGWGKDGLLFPGTDGTNLPHSSYAWHFTRAREAAGRPDLRPHDLRHTGAVLAASTGATLAELMARLGHSTPAAALRYQHAAAGRDAEIATKLSALADPSKL